MTRRVNKFDVKMPTTLPISKRPSSRVDLQTRLRKIDQEFQQDQQFIPSSSSTFMISNLKQQLSHIKQDVQKLMVDDDFQHKPYKIQTNSGLKQELMYQKEVEEQLRKQIKELKMRSSEWKARDDRTGYLMKQIEILKRQQDILSRQKDQAIETVDRLRKQLSVSQLSQGLESQLLELKRKSQRQRQQKQELERTKKLLQSQNSKLILQLSAKTKEKQYFDGSVSEWKQERYRMQNQISRLKMALTNAENNPEWKQQTIRFENQISKLKMQVATSVSAQDWKQQKTKLEEQIAKYKQMSLSTGDQSKEQKTRLQNQISRLQVEAKKSKQLLDGKYKSNKQQMVSSINSIKDLTEKNYQFVRKINNMESQLMEKSNQLRKKQELVLQQKEDIKIITKQKDSRYTNLMSEFRKLQDTLNKSAQQNLIGMKNSIFSLQNSLRSQQTDKQKLRNTIAELNQKIQRANFNISEQKRINQQLSLRIKQQAKNSQENEVKISKRMSIKLQELDTELINSKKQISQKQNLISSYSNQIKELQNYKMNQQKFKIIQMQSLNTSYQVSQLLTQITNLKQNIQILEVQLFEKNKVIQKLSQTTQNSSSQQEISQVESKYKDIVEQLNITIEQNEMIILRLENEVCQLKQIAKKSNSVGVKNTSFDDVFKEHIKQNQQLKLSLKNKSQQIFSLKNTIDDFKRKIDYQRNESEIDKLKNLSDEKKIKSYYEIQIQNMASEVQSQKRKCQALQSRLDNKVDEIKKKDQFIQNVIISKVGKDAYSSDLEYVTKEVSKFFNVNYGDKLIVAEEQIKLLKEKIQAQRIN